MRPTPALGLVAGVGGRSAQAWRGFGVRNGAGMTWSAGTEFHDARDPWTVRFGLGQEIVRGVPEPRAGIVSLGFGWSFGAVRTDLGVLRRSLQRADEPTSADDRVVGSLEVAF